VSSERRVQADRILALLVTHAEVPLPEILRLGIASHTARISDLRKRGFDIRMHDKWEGRTRKVWYELVSSQMELP
jgi:Helix-turn-helix domain